MSKERSKTQKTVEKLCRKHGFIVTVTPKNLNLYFRIINPDTAKIVFLVRNEMYYGKKRRRWYEVVCPEDCFFMSYDTLQEAFKQVVFLLNSV